MKKIKWLLLFTFLAPLSAFSQDWHIGGFAGITNYSGDLAQSRVDMRYTRPALGLMVKRDINRYLTLRAGLNWGHIAGADSTNESKVLVSRNLSFRSVIWDGHFIAEFNFLDIYDRGFTPYVFGGVALFQFYPTTKDSLGNTVTLRRLSTEGQNTPEYPERRQYALHQISLPFGAGVKVMLNDTWTLGLEIGFRKTFTDYLDDVSKTYVDQRYLLSLAGQKAVDFAYRGDEVHTKGITPGTYPADGTQRGSDAHNDWYIFSGLTLTYRLGGGGMYGKQKFSTCPKY
ncbi:MAG TPA: DUF6089 family protein [Chitinophaga sp.]|uniref:type IX secretion system protein PorG n=1 Tax=Chitinophaga sp. TaxID=1869181 RepID=UPI002DBC46EE|nr:DUF6089 family protein [Chitinophaga sp.]HEU4555648.1 DUF6089 family protein [Chitinophaga sp.]